MVRIIIVIVLILKTAFCSAQQKELDSLLKLLKNHPKEDTIKYNLLDFTAYYYSLIDPKKGLQYAKEQVSLAKKLNNLFKIASSYTNIGLNYAAAGNDSMAIENYHRALAMHQSNNNQHGIAVAYNNIGLTFFNLSDYVKALEYHLNSLRTFEELKDSARLPAMLANIGVDYQYLSDYPKALDYYFKALKIAEKTGNKRAQATTFGNIGLVYKNFSSYQLALRYQLKALDLYKSTGNKQGVASTLGNIGVVYNLMGKYDSAIAHYQRALVINNEIGNKRRIASDINIIGIAHNEMKEYSSSLSYLKKALVIYEELDDKNNLAITLTQLGSVYSKAPNSILLESGINPGEKFTRALNYQNRALKLSQEIHAVDRQSEVWHALGHTYEAKNDFSNALMAYKNYTLLHDSIVSDEKKQEIIQKGLQYKFEKKEDSLKIVNEKKYLINVAEIKRQKTTKRFIFWSGIILFLSALTIFIFYKRKIDAEQQRKEAELKAEVSDTEMKALRAQMNPHFIFNSLNSISDYIAKNEHEKADEYLTQFARLMRMTLENSEKKLILLSDDLKVLELYLQLECRRLKSKFDYEINVAGNINKENTLVPPMILQPFVENSIWHGIANKEGKGNIVISISRKGGMLHCLIDDDGVGRKSASQLHNSNHNQSLGMKITKTRIDIMNKVKKSNGTVELSDLAIGMRVQINLPFELNF